MGRVQDASGLTTVTSMRKDGENGRVIRQGTFDEARGCARQACPAQTITHEHTEVPGTFVLGHERLGKVEGIISEQAGIRCLDE